MRATAAVAIALLAFAGCSSSDNNNPGNPGGPGGGLGPMSASIDGQAWAAGAQSVLAQAVQNAPGTYLIEGTQLVGSTPTTILVTLYNTAGPGIFPLGVTPTVFGGTASLTVGGVSWSTPLSGAAGAATITALTPTRIAGSFAFAATPLAGGTGTRTVTGGQFDLPLSTSGTLPTVPDNAGSRVSMSMAGTFWNAATPLAMTNGSFSVGLP
jgi:hypothetical protein